MDSCTGNFVLYPRGVADAHDRAKVGGQVRFLPGILVVMLGPDGQAAACKAVEVGSNPTCIS